MKERSGRECIGKRGKKKRRGVVKLDAADPNALHLGDPGTNPQIKEQQNCNDRYSLYYQGVPVKGWGKVELDPQLPNFPKYLYSMSLPGSKTLKKTELCFYLSYYSFGFYDDMDDHIKLAYSA